MANNPLPDAVAPRFVRALAPKMSPTELWLFDLGPAPRISNPALSANEREVRYG